MSRLRILASHPVQYHVPFYRALVNSGVDVEVGYYHQGSAGRAAFDDQFGIDIEWDVDLLSGHAHTIFSRTLATYGLVEQLIILPRMLTWALRERHTPLMLMGWFAFGVWVVWLLRLLIGSQVLVMCETTPKSFEATSKPFWRNGLLGWMLRRSTACMYIGEQNRAFLSSMGAKRLYHLPYSIDSGFFQRESQTWLPKRHELCVQYGLSPELPTFLFSGKLIPKKHPVELLRAYIDAGLQDIAQLVFVGEGELRPQMEAIIRQASLKHVHLLGFLNQTAMPAAYVMGEILCLISEPTETWGLVVNEALACGRPVIVADTVGCAPDLVGPENGWVIPLGDWPALARTLRTAHEQRPQWPSMGAQGLERLAHHTFEEMAKAVQRALDGLDTAQTIDSGTKITTTV